jgi:hypothetical protein
MELIWTKPDGLREITLEDGSEALGISVLDFSLWNCVAQTTVHDAIKRGEIDCVKYERPKNIIIWNKKAEDWRPVETHQKTPKGIVGFDVAGVFYQEGTISRAVFDTIQHHHGFCKAQSKYISKHDVS